MTVGELTVELTLLMLPLPLTAPPGGAEAPESPEPPEELLHKSTHADPFHRFPIVRSTQPEPVNRLRVVTSTAELPEYRLILMLSPHQSHRSPSEGLEGADCCT